jgi:hypothetical protein
MDFGLRSKDRYGRVFFFVLSMGLDGVPAWKYITRSLRSPAKTMRAARNRRSTNPDAARSGDRDGSDIVHRSRDEHTDWAFEILFGLGALEREDAVSRVEEAFVLLGLTPDEELDVGGPATRSLIEKAIDAGIKQGRFDKPKRGQVRAVRVDPKEYSSEDWTLCLTNALDREPIDREAALRFAAYWAASNMGLGFARLQRGGAILTGLDAALETALNRGRFLDAGGGCVRKA